MKFTEAQLESAIIELLGAEGYRHVLDEAIDLPDTCPSGPDPYFIATSRRPLIES